MTSLADQPGSSAEVRVRSSRFVWRLADLQASVRATVGRIGELLERPDAR